MLHKIVILKRAYTHFQIICDYIANEFGEKVADEFEFEVENCVATLMKFPESGHPEPIRSKYQYRSKIVGEYNKMYYFINRNTLVIAAFADMRMHPNHIVEMVTGKR